MMIFIEAKIAASFGIIVRDYNCAPKSLILYFDGRNAKLLHNFHVRSIAGEGMEDYMKQLSE